MIPRGRNFKEIERKKIGKKSKQKQSKNRGKTELYEISQAKKKPLRNQHYATKPFRNTLEFSARIFAAAKAILAHVCHFATQ